MSKKTWIILFLLFLPLVLGALASFLAQWIWDPVPLVVFRIDLGMVLFVIGVFLSLLASVGFATQAEKQLFLLELQMGNRPYAEMVERRDRLTLGDQEGKDTEQLLVNLQFNEILRSTPRDQQAKGGAQFLPMYRAGRIPTTSTETSFWQYLFAHAEAKRDVPLFEELLAFVQKERAGDRRLQRYLPQLQAQLEKLKQQRDADK